MIERLRIIENRYEEIAGAISDPAVIADQDRYRRLLIEMSDLQPVVDGIREHARLTRELEDSRALFSDSQDHELRELAREEIEALEKQVASLEADLLERVSPKDPRDERSVIVEIRAGAGGEEAALFAAVLYRMYTMYAERCGWSTELVDANATEIGGFKEVVFTVEGRGAYSRLKYESGVHRVQRVPVTESGGRIHTSTVTVAVLPEADAVEVDIQPGDLEIDTYRASGAGGQHVNRTDSAIRITHKPSGIVVTCQDQRSQYKNRDQAMAVLRARLLEREQSRAAGAVADERKSQVGTGDRSERIRTYNYPQGRVTDHRIGLTLYKIESILTGDLDDIIRPLTAASRANALGRAPADDAGTGDKPE
ncbi:MAG: peptide chain release factor 1 [Clostridia bacterium]|nr:peptide chain release factor 1 [Clostridia bacterium]